MRTHLLVDVPLAASAIAACPSLGWPAPAAAGALALAMHAWGVLDPRSSLYLPVWWRLPPSSTGCALTFDDGPNPGVTDALLDRLGAAGLQATFFLIGAHVRRHGALVRRMRAEGHGIGLHSDSHSRWFNCWGPRHLARDIEACAAAIADATGTAPPRLFRPPVGLKNPMVGVMVQRLDLVAVTWSARGRDTGGAGLERILRRLEPRVRPRAILLLHDGHEPSRPASRASCLAVVDRLAARMRERALACEVLGCSAAGLTGCQVSAAGAATPAPAAGTPAR